MDLSRNMMRGKPSDSRADPKAVTPVVFVVDKDRSVRESLDSLIRTHEWHPLTFACATDFLEHPRPARPCCLVLEVDLPDLSGLELQQRVSDRNDMPVIFITRDSDVRTTVRAMKAGALEYLTKPFANEVLLTAISFALDRSAAVLSHETARRAVGKRYASLSHREREVMALVVSGWLNKQICAALGITEITVKVHRGKVMRKMRAGSLAELVKMAATLDVATTPRPNESFFRSFVTRAVVPTRSSEISAALASASA